MSGGESERQKVLVLSLSELASDNRVLRQVEFLARRYEVVAAAFGGPPALPSGVEFLELRTGSGQRLRRRLESGGRIALRLAGLYRSAYWLDTKVREWRDQLATAVPVDAVVVNDLFGIPLAREVAGEAPLVFDAHEHWTSESASWTRLQRLSMRGAHDWLVDRHVSEAAAMMTVSAGIARDFEQRVGISPFVVTSAPFFQELRPSEVSLPIRLLHIGVADPRRRLEDTIEAVRSLDGGFALDLVLVRDNEYRRQLERLATDDPRIRVLPPVPADELVSFANSYDVGVFLLPERYPNQVHVLPNKLFDYIQARLAVAIGPSPEMVRIVRDWDCGVVSGSFATDAFAQTLAGLTVPEVERMKENADRAAHVLTAEANRDTVVSLVGSVMARAGN